MSRSSGSPSAAARLVARALRPAVRATRAPWTLEASVVEDRGGPEAPARVAARQASGVPARSGARAVGSGAGVEPALEMSPAATLSKASSLATGLAENAATAAPARLANPAPSGRRGRDAPRLHGDEPPVSIEGEPDAAALPAIESEPAWLAEQAPPPSAASPARAPDEFPLEEALGHADHVSSSPGRPAEPQPRAAVPPGTTQLGLVTHPPHHDRVTARSAATQAQPPGYPSVDLPVPQVRIDQIHVVTPPAKPPAPDPFASLAAHRVGASRHGGGGR